MKTNFALLYILNLIKKNPIKIIAIALISIVFPFLNSLEDVRVEDRIDYQYQKDGRYFYVIADPGYKSGYEIQSYETPPAIKGGYIISYSYDERNILIWIVFIFLCIFPIAGIFSSDDNGFELGEVFEATVSYYITCELEEGIYYYFYGERFLGKSDRPLHKEYSYVARAFGINNMASIRNCPVWKTKTQNRASKLQEIGV